MIWLRETQKLRQTPEKAKKGKCGLVSAPKHLKQRWPLNEPRFAMFHRFRMIRQLVKNTVSDTDATLFCFLSKKKYSAESLLFVRNWIGSKNLNPGKNENWTLKKKGRISFRTPLNVGASLSKLRWCCARRHVNFGQFLELFCFFWTQVSFLSGPKVLSNELRFVCPLR